MTALPRACLLVAVTLALASCRQPPAEPEATPTAPPVAGTPPAPTGAAPPAPEGQVPRAFLCRGNEPFWALDISANGALLKSPEEETALIGELKATRSGAFAFQGAPDGSPSEVVGVLVAPGKCFDTMADGPASDFTGQVSFADGRAGSGCCSAEYGLDLAAAPAFDVGAKPQDDWTRHLPELSEALGRCVLDAGVATAAVTKAWPTDQGKAGFRLRDTGDARFDCVIDLESGEIETVAAVAEGDTLPGEGRPVWLPAGERPPVLDCGRVERVLDVGDEVAGYLHYREGCN